MIYAAGHVDSLIKGHGSADIQKVKVFSRLIAVSLFLFMSVSPLQSQESDDARERAVPQLLEGIWENYSRYIVFDTGYTSAAGEAIPQIVLRTFYQWYDDRAAESPEYSASVPRSDNNTTATSSVAQEIHVRFVPLTDQLFTDSENAVVRENGDLLYAENENSGAWDMQVDFVGKRFGGRQIYHIPVAVIGDRLYLKFALRVDDSEPTSATAILNGTILESEYPMAGYWQDYGNANGILESPPIVSKELLSYFVTDSAVYPIRYWTTDMDYDENAVASIVDGDETYYVKKHLWVGDKNYTCTLGRRTQIRNLQKTDSLPKPYTTNSVLVEKHATDDEGNEFSYTVRTSTICAFGEPYLTLTDGSKSIEEIVAEDNARRKDPPEPLFPVHGGPIDFDWSIIEDPPKDYNRRMLDLGK